MGKVKSKPHLGKFNTIIKCVLFILVVGIIKFGLEALLGKIDYFKENFFLSALVSNLLLGILLVIFLWYAKRINLLKFNKQDFFKGLKISLVLVVFFILSIVTSCVTYASEGRSFLSFSSILICILAMFGVGFFEEILFRGVVLNNVLDAFGRDTRKNVIKSIVIASLLFGLIHLTNVFFGDTDISTSATMAVNSIFSGLCFSAIYVRSRSLYPVMFVHGLLDLCGFVALGSFFDVETAFNNSGASGSTPGVIAIMCFINLIVFLVLLREKKTSEYVGINKKK